MAADVETVPGLTALTAPDLTAPDLVQCLGLETPRAKSLIVTVYGDSLLPYGGQCWLGDLIALVAPLGLNERVTRTAVFRLVQDGILAAKRIGRRSRYTLTRIGRRQFDSAQSRIYASEPPARDGQWTLIALSDQVTAAQRDALMRELIFQGFARLSSGLLGAARGDAGAGARAVLADLETGEAATLFTGVPEAACDLPALAARAWPLENIAAEYEYFLKRFGPLRNAVLRNDDRTAYIARTLLIHTYRRALLPDPALSDPLLPADWPGHAARRLAADLYRRLGPAADRFLAGRLGPPPAGTSIAQRFA